MIVCSSCFLNIVLCSAFTACLLILCVRTIHCASLAYVVCRVCPFVFCKCVCCCVCVCLMHVYVFVLLCVVAQRDAREKKRKAEMSKNKFNTMLKQLPTEQKTQEEEVNACLARLRQESVSPVLLCCMHAVSSFLLFSSLFPSSVFASPFRHSLVVMLAHRTFASCTISRCVSCPVALLGPWLFVTAATANAVVRAPSTELSAHSPASCAFSARKARRLAGITEYEHLAAKTAY